MGTAESDENRSSILNKMKEQLNSRVDEKVGFMNDNRTGDIVVYSEINSEKFVELLNDLIIEHQGEKYYLHMIGYPRERDHPDGVPPTSNVWTYADIVKMEL